jgi:hypothetical protein
VLRAQNKQGRTYKGNNWPSGTNEREGHDLVPFDEPKGPEGLTMGFKRV